MDRVTFKTQMRMQVVARCDDEFNPLVLIVLLVAVQKDVIGPIKAEHAAMLCGLDRLPRVGTGLGWRREFGPVFVSTFMKRNESLIFISSFLTEDADEVLDVSGVVFHLTRMVPLDREGHSVTDLIEVDLFSKVIDVFLQDLTHHGIMTIKQLDHLDGRIDQGNDQYEESNNASSHGVHGSLALQIETGQRLAKYIE